MLTDAQMAILREAGKSQFYKFVPMPPPIGWQGVGWPINPPDIEYLAYKHRPALLEFADEGCTKDPYPPHIETLAFRITKAGLDLLLKKAA